MRTAALLVLAAFSFAGPELPAAAQGTPPATQEAAPFSFDQIVARAETLSGEADRAPATAPEGARALDYDAYRRITFVEDRADFRDSPALRLHYTPAGSLFTAPVKVNLVRDGAVVERGYAAEDFRFYDLPLTDEEKAALGFAGFKLTTPLNSPRKFDEFVSFAGASYFRALSAGATYGTSARGLAIDTASPAGEEFPRFSEFWLEVPQGEERTVRINALLESASVTGAYRFTVRPGIVTTMDVEAVLFPRRELGNVGLAPLSSMFEFGPQDPLMARRDYRPRVHDADGLMVHLANGERLWRPLTNPKGIEISSFAAQVPQSFGLAQRQRSAEAYQDLEALYERRPSVIITPKSGFSEGELILVEIPTPNEFNDNIVTYWRPRTPWAKGARQEISYSMSWGLEATAMPAVARVKETRIGREVGGKRPMVVVDFESGHPALLDGATPQVTATNGTISDIVLRDGATPGTKRLSFFLERDTGAEPSELRAVLNLGTEQVSETWLYRWTDL